MWSNFEFLKKKKNKLDPAISRIDFYIIVFPKVSPIRDTKISCYFLCSYSMNVLGLFVIFKLISGHFAALLINVSITPGPRFIKT